ncbi:MAG: hypothetical protein NDI73_00260 [Desulfuromonadales bacterium]|nr:hypothetical protein [Desulfuromonadales bacterium]
MNLQCIDVSKCQRPQKKVSAGLCLSYDLLRGLCLETMEPCVAVADEAETGESA